MIDAWDGRPLNPEQNGAHWITDSVAYWEADKGRWLLMMKAKAVSPEWLASQPWAEYRGPCLLPSEIAAREEAVRREEREACAAATLALRDAWRNGHGQRKAVAYAEAIAAAIRARGEV